jgi:hypothetical protein
MTRMGLSGHPTLKELERAKAVLVEQLAREGAGPPSIGDRDLRTCLAAVQFAITQEQQ